MYLTSHFGFAAMASGNDLESDVIAFNINTGMLRQKGARTIAKPITTSINSPKKTLTQEWRVLFPFFAVLALRKWSETHRSVSLSSSSS